MCNSKLHDPLNGNRWHRTTDEKGRRFATECPEYLAAKTLKEIQRNPQKPEREHREGRYGIY